MPSTAAAHEIHEWRRSDPEQSEPRSIQDGAEVDPPAPAAPGHVRPDRHDVGRSALRPSGCRAGPAWPGLPTSEAIAPADHAFDKSKGQASRDQRLGRQTTIFVSPIDSIPARRIISVAERREWRAFVRSLEEHHVAVDHVGSEGESTP